MFIRFKYNLNICILNMILGRRKMIRVKLYEELTKKNMIVIKCEKMEFKKTLLSLTRETGYVMDDFVVRVTDKGYMIYIRKGIEGGLNLQIAPAAKIRFETKFETFENDMARIDNALPMYSVKPGQDKYCLMKQIDFEDDFIITDVYIAM